MNFINLLVIDIGSLIIILYYLIINIVFNLPNMGPVSPNYFLWEKCQIYINVKNGIIFAIKGFAVCYFNLDVIVISH